MINYCPMCGTKTVAKLKVCGKCGLDLVEYQKKLDRLAAAQSKPIGKRRTFKIGSSELSFDETIFKMAEISRQINSAQDSVLQSFSESYTKSGNIEDFLIKVDSIAVESLKNAALVGVKACTDKGMYDLTSEILISAPASDIDDVNGKKLSQTFETVPLKIFQESASVIQNRYNEIVNVTSDSGGSFVDKIPDSFLHFVPNPYIIMLNVASDAIGLVKDAATSLSKSSSKGELYKNNATLNTYCLGLIGAMNVLKFRIFAILGFGDQTEAYNKSSRILENIRSGSQKSEKIFDMAIKALSYDPSNLEIYDVILTNFGDESGEFETIAAAMSLNEEITFIKKNIFVKKLESHPKISEILRANLSSNQHIIDALTADGAVSVGFLKNDYAIMQAEAAKLRVQTFDDDKIGQIFETYKTMIESLEVEEIPDRIPAFKYLREDMESFEIPEGTTVIGGYAFANCENLKEIKFPSTLKIIEAGAFYGCKISQIDLPEGVKEISFNIASGDTLIYLPNTIEKIVGNYNVTPNTVHFSFDETTSVAQLFPANETYDRLVSKFSAENLKENTLGENAFFVNKGILDSKSFVGVNKTFEVTAWAVQVVLREAFAHSKLKIVHFSEHLKVIHDNAFEGCRELEHLILPFGTRELGNEICKGCKNLKFLFVPDTVKIIGEDILKGSNAIIYCSPKSFAAEYCRKNKLKSADGAKELFNKAKKIAANSTNAKDMARALDMYKLAFEMGNAAAAYEAGKCYLNRLGVAERNVVSAMFYFGRAAELGNKAAMYELYKIYKDGLYNLPKNEELAAKWLERSGYHSEKNTAPDANQTDIKSKPINGYEEILDFREELFQEFGDIRCVYFADKTEKGNTKIQKAINAYAKDASQETVFFVFDNTIFGWADEGFLVTNEAVYVRNITEEPFRIPLEQIQTLNNEDKNILINDEFKILCPMSDKKSSRRLVTALKKIKENLAR